MRFFRYCILSAALLAACACGHKEVEKVKEETSISPAEQFLLAVRGTDRLYTTEYVVNKAVTYDDIIKVRGSVFSKKFDFAIPQGARKIIIPMQASIKAYIDFSGFGRDNVQFSPDSSAIRIILPDPKIVLSSTRIDHDGIVALVDFGRSRFSQADMAEYEKQGRAAIISAIPEMGITETARLDAYEVLLPMVEAMGYSPQQITIDFRKDFDEMDYMNSLITAEMKR